MGIKKCPTLAFSLFRWLMILSLELRESSAKEISVWNVKARRKAWPSALLTVSGASHLSKMQDIQKSPLNDRESNLARIHALFDLV